MRKKSLKKQHLILKKKNILRKVNFGPNTLKIIIFAQRKKLGRTRY